MPVLEFEGDGETPEFEMVLTASDEKTITTDTPALKYNIPDKQLNEADAKILSRNPALNELTKQERHRFIQGLGITNLKKVQADLSIYLRFRKTELKSHKEHLMSINPNGDMFDESFYRSVKMTGEITNTVDATKVLYILPATFIVKKKKIPLYRDDLTIGKYLALTLACYLDSKLPRDSLEKMTIIIDSRIGEGGHFGNPSVHSLIPIFRDTVSILQSMFQERLKRLIIFPMPATAMFAWNFIKVFIDEDSHSRYILIGSTKENSKKHSDPPKELRDYLRNDSIQRLEKRRRDMFISN